MKHYALARNGNLELSIFTRKLVKENEGMRFEVKPITPESSNLRRFFEGAVVPLITYYQEGMDHRNPQHLKMTREWLKQEFNSEGCIIGGKFNKVSQSTKGKLRDFIDKVVDWASENGYKVEVSNPDGYKEWVATIFPYGGPDNYIDYLREIKKL